MLPNDMTKSRDAPNPAPADPAAEAVAPASAAAPLSAWWVLLVVMLLSLYTIADRPLFNLQVEALRRELSLTDFQIGMVQGFSVALFTAFVGYPIAWLADRYDRRWVLAASIGVWSASLALMGLSRSFEELFVASAFVGAGEAALVPIALALMPELFRGPQRHLANSCLVLAGRLGAGLVVAMCGWLVVAVETWRSLLPDMLQALATWRLSLLVAAVPGVFLVLLIITLPLVRARAVDRPQGADPAETQTAAGGADPVPGAAVLPFLGSHRLAFASFYLGVATMVFGIGCVMNFAPVIAMRQMSATPLQVGNLMGAATLVATVVGFLIAQVGYRKLAPRLGPGLPAMALLAAAVLAGLLALGLWTTRSPLQLFVGVGVFLTVVMAGTLLFPLALQDMAPAPVRGRLAAIAITLNIVLGSLGPAVVGAVSDRLKGHADGLMLAMIGVTVVAMLLSSLLLLPLQARYVRTVAAARQAEAAATPQSAAH